MSLPCLWESQPEAHCPLLLFPRVGLSKRHSTIQTSKAFMSLPSSDKLTFASFHELNCCRQNWKTPFILILSNPILHFFLRGSQYHEFPTTFLYLYYAQAPTFPRAPDHLPHRTPIYHIVCRGTIDFVFSRVPRNTSSLHPRRSRAAWG